MAETIEKSLRDLDFASLMCISSPICAKSLSEHDEFVKQSHVRFAVTSKWLEKQDISRLGMGIVEGERHTEPACLHVRHPD